MLTQIQVFFFSFFLFTFCPCLFLSITEEASCRLPNKMNYGADEEPVAGSRKRREFCEFYCVAGHVSLEPTLFLVLGFGGCVNAVKCMLMLLMLLIYIGRHYRIRSIADCFSLHIFAI